MFMLLMECNFFSTNTKFDDRDDLIEEFKKQHQREKYWIKSSELYDNYVENKYITFEILRI